MDEIDFGTDKEADKASAQLREKSKCSGTCGRTWQEADGGIAGFIALDDGRICSSPVWICSTCHEERARASYERAMAQVPMENQSKIRALHAEIDTLREESAAADKRVVDARTLPWDQINEDPALKELLPQCHAAMERWMTRVQEISQECVALGWPTMEAVAGEETPKVH